MFKKFVNKVKLFFAKRFIKDKVKKLDCLREELEDKFAAVLQKVDENTNIDEKEVELISLGINAAQTYFGTALLDEDTRKAIAEKVVECLGKINKKMQEQLRK